MLSPLLAISIKRDHIWLDTTVAETRALHEVISGGTRNLVILIIFFLKI